MGELELLEQRWIALRAMAGQKKMSKLELDEYWDEVHILSKKMAILRAKEHQELTEELEKIGIIINNIFDLVNTKIKYPKAIPILIKHLQKNYSEKIKEGIIRSLTVIEAKGKAVPILVNEYLKIPKDNESIRWAIGNAVNVTITKEEAELIFPIVLNKGNGLSRQMFVAALGKINTEKVREILKQLLNDEDKVISEEAQKALKKLEKKNLPKNT
ncbi:MAG TPA: hypothetical protein PLZ32_18540 [Saprospiraceae bacterium]|nr:hypothetical protein [Saprospiraceae bacterium]